MFDGPVQARLTLPPETPVTRRLVGGVHFAVVAARGSLGADSLPALSIARRSASTDSNVWRGDSGHTYTFTRNPDRTTDIDYVVVREGKNLKGRFLGLVLRTVGKSRLETAFHDSVKAIEARNYEPKTADSRTPTVAIAS
jgi:hypothetical protein